MQQGFVLQHRHTLKFVRVIQTSANAFEAQIALVDDINHATRPDLALGCL